MLSNKNIPPPPFWLYVCQPSLNRSWIERGRGWTQEMHTRVLIYGYKCKNQYTETIPAPGNSRAASLFFLSKNSLDI